MGGRTPFIPILMSSYNKREDDFPSQRAYDDYLQEVEDMSESATQSAK